MKNLLRLFKKPASAMPMIEVDPVLLPAVRAVLENPEAAQYVLQMVWQGRTSKVSPEALPVYDWLTVTFIDKCQAGEYLGFMPNVCQFEGHSHQELAKVVLTRALAAQPYLRVKEQSPLYDGTASALDY